jgi:hypothetical protein
MSDFCCSIGIIVIIITSVVIVIITMIKIMITLSRLFLHPVSGFERLATASLYHINLFADLLHSSGETVAPVCLLSPV